MRNGEATRRSLQEIKQTAEQKEEQMAEKAEAKARRAAMMNSGELTILGSSIAGVPFDSVITMTKQQVWGNETNRTAL